MAEQLTIEQFEAQLQGLGEQLTNLDAILLEIAGRLVNQLKAGAPVNTGNLRNSIQALVESNTLTIQMLMYGLFQNYGVDGTQNRVAREVPFGIDPRPRNEPFYSFNPEKKMIGGNLPFGARVQIHRMGIKPQTFFDLDLITTTISEELANKGIQF